MSDAAQKTPKLEDVLRTLYDRNDHYHDIKERVVWLAGVVYLTFSVVLIAWYLGLENKNIETGNGMFSIPGLKERYIKVFLFAIFVLTAVFILWQTLHKVAAAVKTGQFNELIRKLDDLCGNSRNYNALMDANTYNKKILEGVWDFVCMGWSGHLVFGVVYSFFLAQMVAIFGFCHWRPVLPGRWILLVLIPYILPLLTILLNLLAFLGRKSKKK